MEQRTSEGGSYNKIHYNTKTHTKGGNCYFTVQPWTTTKTTHNQGMTRHPIKDFDMLKVKKQKELHSESERQEFCENKKKRLPNGELKLE